MKISLALIVAFVILLGALEAKAKSTTLPSAKIDDHVQNNNLGRKGKVGAINNNNIEGNKADKVVNSVEEDENDVNEAYGQTGSKPSAEVHRNVIDKNGR